MATATSCMPRTNSVVVGSSSAVGVSAASAALVDAGKLKKRRCKFTHTDTHNKVRSQFNVCSLIYLL